MPKDKGWVKIHRKILATKLTASQFKFFVGAILLAKTPKSQDSGLVDFSVRQLASELSMSSTEVYRRERELAEMGMIGLLPKGFRIHNYHYYQTGKGVPYTKQPNNKSVPQAGRLFVDGVSPTEQSVSPTEQSVSPTEQSVSHLEPKPTPKKIKNNKKIKKGDATKRPADPVIGEIFKEMRGYFGYPTEIDQDPIPSYGKEGQAIKRMLTRGFSAKQIFACWKAKVTERGEFVSMVWVNEDIGKKGGQDGTHRQPTAKELRESVERPLR